jgi:hypothetical protein
MNYTTTRYFYPRSECADRVPRAVLRRNTLSTVPIANWTMIDRYMLSATGRSAEPGAQGLCAECGIGARMV